MKVGIGYHNGADAFQCGKLATEQALSTGGVENASLVLAFCHGQHEAPAFLEGIRSLLPEQTPVIGGSAIGVITNEEISYRDHPAGVAVVELEEGIPPLASAGRLDENARATGRRLGAQLREEAPGQAMLLFYDSIQRPPSRVTPPVINASPPLIAGIEESLGSGYPIVGAGLLGSYNFEPPHQFTGFTTASQSAIGLLLNQRLIAGVRIMHGCRPLNGDYHTLSRVQGPIILEIDDRPAAAVIDDALGHRKWRREKPVNGITLGINYENKGGGFREDAFVNRLIAGIMPDGESILMFEPDLVEGAEVLFMQRNGGTMVESAKRNTAALLDEVLAAGRTPKMGLYIDCAGRTAAHSRTPTEESAEVQAVMNRHGIPLLGLFSGVEVAPLKGRSRGLDWTGVLLLLADA